MTSEQVKVHSPVGAIRVRWEGGLLSAIAFAERERHSGPTRVEGVAPHEEGRILVTELADYLEGKRRAFSFRPEFRSGSGFQRDVWRAVSGVAYGRTCSYGALAAAAGHPGAAQAVGGALGSNPFPILVPCHRVVGADGALTGFGGGLAWKRALLRLEADCVPGQVDLFGRSPFDRRDR